MNQRWCWGNVTGSLTLVWFCTLLSWLNHSLASVLKARILCVCVRVSSRWVVWHTFPSLVLFALGPRSDTGVQNFLPGQTWAVEEGLSRASKPPAHGYESSQYQPTESWNQHVELPIVDRKNLLWTLSGVWFLNKYWTCSFWLPTDISYKQGSRYPELIKTHQALIRTNARMRIYTVK